MEVNNIALSPTMVFMKTGWNQQEAETTGRTMYKDHIIYSHRRISRKQLVKPKLYDIDVFVSHINGDVTFHDILDLLDLPVLLSHCVAFMTDLNVGQIISNTNSLVLVQF